MTEIDVETMLTIHRDPRAFIGFVRKPDPKAPPRFDKHGRQYTFENLGALQVENLRGLLPGFAAWLVKDAYFTVESYYRGAPWQNTLTGLPDVWRKEKFLKWLTACYVDVDCGRPESSDPGAALSWRVAMARIGSLADSDIIPQPSFFARSGRGVYCLWLLHDPEHPERLQRAWPEKLLLFKDVNRALGTRLRDYELPADPKAIDAARVLRVPGSLHTGARREVKYIIQLDQDKNPFLYTLNELASFMDVKTTKTELPGAARSAARPFIYRKAINPGSAPGRQYSQQRLHALRAEDMLTVEAWRGGFLKRGMKYPDGSTSPGRRLILGLYAGFLRGSHAGKPEALKALSAMAANMKPPYPSDPADPPLEDIARGVYEEKFLRRWKNEKLCALLGITADAAKQLNLETIMPKEVKEARYMARPMKADAIAARRAFAQDQINRRGGFLSARGLARLYEANGFAVGKSIAARDLASLKATAPAS